VNAATGLLVAAVAWPLFLAAALALPALRGPALRLAPTLATPALLLAFMPVAEVTLYAPGVFTNMLLALDALGRPFLLLTALLWTAAGIHAAAYMRADSRRTGFTAFLLVTGAGNIGVTIAADALAFYLFFALMTFAAYGLVIHERTSAAIRAGRVYIIMAVLGEALIVAGLVILVAHAADASFARLQLAWLQIPQPAATAALLAAGFGVKAGMIPLHMWLPLAHPVAPTPASALLSGAMIKAGIIGWLRILPIGSIELPGPGGTLMLLGAAATIYGAAVGVTQRDAKTVLAYSSISQIGFLTVGIGAALAVPAAAGLLILAVAAYALHHALAKAALFLAISVPRGPAGWGFLLTAALPALALAGAPLSSGAIAKSALKSALGDVPPPGGLPVDTLLYIAAAGTTLLMARYLSILAGGTTPADSRAGRAPAGIVLPWAALVAASASAAAWLPWSLAALGELPRATGTAGAAGAAGAADLATAIWPIAVGAIAAAAASRLARRSPALTALAIPAGDILAVVERAVSIIRAVPVHTAAGTAGQRLRQTLRRAGRTAARTVDDSTAAFELEAIGAGLGVAFALLGLLLFLTLR
jgi:formate hydrogenlyase subunit 3/multisubunit Na+/H+ antiporter MnhD subunit